ncbi:MAG: TonB-dependent receptor [Odoribacteraceae bacterium]|jgi:hypothetical protein|nr:TonB-dependent receptor [Odoribacteraceae bacterium]
MDRIYLIFARFAFLLLLPGGVAAQEGRFTVSGKITDAATGLALAGANVSLPGGTRGRVADARGFYSIDLPRGRHALLFSHVGYAGERLEVDVTGARRLDVALVPRAGELEGVTVSAGGRLVERPGMSVERLSATAIKRVPALMGEVDVIKAIQLLPGVQSTAEGTSGFSVRGGSHDQNLILLDDATVYSASHLMGFFSVFNNDAVKDIILYKGDMPATFGGRLSSLLEIRTREGNDRRLSATGGIGLISSRLAVEGPLAGERASFLVAGRRTYADLFLALSGDKDLRGTALHFYDLNARVDYRAGERDRLFVAGYVGRDKFANKNAGMAFGNRAISLRWNHVFPRGVLASVALFGSAYDYYIGSEISKQLTQDWKSGMSDAGVKADVTWAARPGVSLKFGYAGVHHRFSPGEGGGIGEEALLERVKYPAERAFEQAAYAAGEINAGNLALKIGIRYSLFHNIANGEEVKYLQDHAYHHSTRPARGTWYHAYGHLEPRLGLAYLFNEVNSVKASYTRAVQHVQVASNSAAGSPLDVWFHSSPNVKPQRGDQLAAGYFRSLAGDAYELSVEVYYRAARDVIDFKDHASLLGNENLEEEVRAGKGRAAGMEWMIRKNNGLLTGWASYTYSRSRRKAAGINDGAWYRSPHDKPHVITLVANHDFSTAWKFSANWIYATGQPVTYPTGRFLVEGRYVPTYSGRNEFRFPDYHRLDLSATRVLSRPGARVTSELNFSLYNAYGRKNPWSIYFRQEKEQPDLSYAEQVYLFGIVPSISWNFTF